MKRYDYVEHHVNTFDAFKLKSEPLIYLLVKLKIYKKFFFLKKGKRYNVFMCIYITQWKKKSNRQPKKQTNKRKDQQYITQRIHKYNIQWKNNNNQHQHKKKYNTQPKKKKINDNNIPHNFLDYLLKNKN